MEVPYFVTQSKYDFSASGQLAAGRTLDMAYPEPTPVLKEKAAKELLEHLNSKSVRTATNAWDGSRELYSKLRPKDQPD